jgi:hypothetical protein
MIDGLAQETERLLGFASEGLDATQIVERPGSIWMVRPKHATLNLERLSQ